MSDGSVTLLLLNFAFIGILPRIFFRKGSFNLQWWLTAAPFFAASAVLMLARAGLLQPAPFRVAGFEPLAVALSAASFAVMAYTLGTHERPLNLWHQAGDTPQHLVTRGAYGRVRHPFYSSFLLSLVAALLLCPHLATAACLVYGVVQLTLTARKEELTFCASALGEDYARYMQTTGRFLPRLRRLA
jgi:protein-S-isoprenylcysteine O-methyltransferase Ste14